MPLIRIAKRVMTRFDRGAAQKPPPPMQKRSVGLGAYVFDCHWVTLYVEHNVTHGEKPYIAAEGRVNQNRQEQDVGGVMQAPYR